MVGSTSNFQKAVQYRGARLAVCIFPAACSHFRPYATTPLVQTDYPATDAVGIITAPP